MTLPEGALGSEASTRPFDKYRQHIFIIEGGWYDGVAYHCLSYDPEYERTELVYGGPGSKKKDVVRWLNRRHSKHFWKLKTEYTGDQWIYTFSRINPAGRVDIYCDRCWSWRVHTGVRRTMEVPSGKEYYDTVMICDDCDYIETIEKEEIKE